MAISKKTCEAMVNKELSSLVKILRLEERDIEVYVLHSDDKNTPLPHYPGLYGVCYNSPRKSRLGIYYDVNKTKKEAFLSLVHELLHVKMYTISKYIKIGKKSKGRYFVAEEEIVASIEKLCYALLKRDKI